MMAALVVTILLIWMTAWLMELNKPAFVVVVVATLCMLSFIGTTLFGVLAVFNDEFE